MTSTTTQSTPSTRRKCPICGKPRDTELAPFCSKRCRDRDLLQWLDDGYALPGPAAPSATEDAFNPGYPQDD